MKIYTKTGDKGESSLFGGTRVPKNHWRLEVYGTLDELNSHLGKALSELQHTGLNNKIPLFVEIQLIKCQETIFTISSHLASENDKAKLRLPDFDHNLVTELENAIDHMNESLPPLTSFILPSGHLAACTLHICRTIARRAERRLVTGLKETNIPDFILVYINRLSDYFFVTSRFINFQAGVKETPWTTK
ncbi:MAG: cob(I)yrinic acid a,c-diamide adenosyltransferase [Bdellovibrionaceae bacterium]|nr:cob(I)yrinic acid a,c-diamide adenosyltransferase [Pseudobdellovibrionaceae bacterium]